MALKEDTDEAESTMEQLVESGAIETAVSFSGKLVGSKKKKMTMMMVMMVKMMMMKKVLK
eukprot:8247801-Ditylum_brightwellii.AAC.1